MPKEKSATKEKKSDVVEIPVGKVLKGLRSNIWLTTALVLTIIIVILLVLLIRSNTGAVLTGTVSADAAADALIDFIESQDRGSATLISAEQEGLLYKITVLFQGQEIPVYLTLDGKYLMTELIPLKESAQQPAARTERVNVSVGDNPFEGSRDAAVTLVEFSDYQCPFCRKFYQESLQQLRENYIKFGNVRFVYKDFPLNIHPEAQKAAEAARCFGEQKGDAGYFKYHDYLFEHQDALSVENYKKWARTLGAAATPFDTCLDSGKYADEVKADLAYGEQLGVTGTPAFFINGQYISGAQPYSVFKQFIDAELAKAA